MDRLTKDIYFIPFIEYATVDNLVYKFLKQIISEYSLPEELISNQDKLFISKFWQSLIKQLGIKHKLSTIYYPQTDRQTERINQILEQYL